MHLDLQYFVYVVENLIQTKITLKDTNRKVPSIMLKISLNKTFLGSLGFPLPILQKISKCF